MNVLDSIDDSSAYYGLAGLNTILASGELSKQDGEENPYAGSVEQMGGMDMLIRCQQPNPWHRLTNCWTDQIGQFNETVQETSLEC